MRNSKVIFKNVNISRANQVAVLFFILFHFITFLVVNLNKCGIFFLNNHHVVYFSLFVPDSSLFSLLSSDVMSLVRCQYKLHSLVELLRDQNCKELLRNFSAKELRIGVLHV